MPIEIGREQQPRGRTFSKYVSMSFLASVVLVYHAVIKHEQFYPAMEYLSTSKISLAILGNLGFASALVLYHVITFVFLGALRDYETERVQDRVGQAIIETLLAMTIFRQNVESFGLLSRFVLLAFMKIFHWLAQDRVDFIETTQHVTVFQHVRLMTMILWLIVSDLFLLHVSLVDTFSHGVSVHLLFAFEYSMQVSVATAVLLKYVFSLVDMGIWNGSWRGKSIAVFYVDLTRDLVHLITYTAFFFVVFSTYGIPIHLIRDIYWTFRNFQTRVRDFLRYRQIAANMENRFPDATEEDLERSDHMCIVCREEMNSHASAKRLPCNHVFHLDCLKSWLERQQNCPICRSPIPARDHATTNGGTNEERDAPMEQQQDVVAATEEHTPADNAHIPEGQEARAMTGHDDARESFLRRIEGRRLLETDEGGPGTATADNDEAPTSTSHMAVEDTQASGTHHDNDDHLMQSSHGEEHREEHINQDQQRRDQRGGSSPPSPPPPQQQQQQDQEQMPGGFRMHLPLHNAEIGEQLRAVATRELEREPTDEQHARALAIATAAAHAATMAAYATCRGSRHQGPRS